MIRHLGYSGIIFHILSAVIIIIADVNFVKAQKHPSEKLMNLYMEAEGYINRKNYAAAEKSLQKLLKKDEGFIEAYLLLGDSYYYSDRPYLAIENYEKAIQLSGDKYLNIYFALGNIKFSLTRYQEALNDYEKYLVYINMSGKNEQLRQNAEKAKRNVANCHFAIEAMNHPVRYEPKNIGAEINSIYPEYFPCLTVDGMSLLFTRRIEDAMSAGGRNLNEDFFVSHLQEGRWTKAENIGKPVNTAYNEGAPCLSPDGQILIFTACEVYGNYGEGRNGYGSCDLFFSRLSGSKWSGPLNMGPPVNSRNWESQPSYSSDGKTIYFVRGSSNRQGEKSQYIYMSILGSDGSWQEPVKLPENINTPGSIQQSVYIHPDNQTMYFSSNGHPGMGGMDIYLSRRTAEGDWGDPENLGYPINTVKDEGSFTVSGDGMTAYIVSDREGGYGDLDIYYFEMPIHARPHKVSYLKGIVSDRDTKKAIYAGFELIDIETGKTAVKSYSNKSTGAFLVCLPVNKDYALNVSADGYLFYSEKFAFGEGMMALTDTLQELKEGYVKDIQMQKIRVGEAVVLKNIFFETDSYELKRESEAELNKLLEFMIKNPGIKIEISGHTDIVGTDDYNLILSQNRARAVYEYLISKNISAERLTFKGYGEGKPIDSNDTEAGRANNRRTEIMVIAE